VLILDSDDDPAIAASVRTVLKALYPSAQTYTFHKAGHTPFLTRREEYLSVVRHFLKEKQLDHREVGSKEVLA
jgi:pimeloyl-ACP methyl ester carboxylesterase